LTLYVASIALDNTYHLWNAYMASFNIWNHIFFKW